MPTNVLQSGQMQIAQYAQNVGGLNLTDSPFAIDTPFATDGYNFDYVKTGGFKKSLAPLLLTETASALLATRGYGLYEPVTGNRALIRAAGNGFETVDMITGAAMQLSLDNAAATNIVFNGSGLAYSEMFTNPEGDILWWTSPALATLTGAISTSRLELTQNGTQVPAGVLTAINIGGGSGTFPTAGNYYYAVTFTKVSTGNESNAALDVLAVVAATSNSIRLDWSGLTNLDLTLYKTVNIYRSQVNGVSNFSAGSLVAQVPVTTTHYTDTGSSLVASIAVPRPSNTALDNSVLPSGSYGCITTWKNRLVTASGNTLYFSDINKSETWPTFNTINVPSGGKITAISNVSYNHPGGSTTDEFLAVWKEDELWMVTGTDYSNWSLQFVDVCGCIQQGLVAEANGMLFWINERGVFLWDGSGKPTYCSRPIEYLFGPDGTLDKNNLVLGTCDFFKPMNQVIWFLSSNIQGIQQYVLKLDLRLTLPQIKNLLGERSMSAVFMQGQTTNYIAACKSIQSPILGEIKQYLVAGDLSGNTYKMFATTVGSGYDTQFQYTTAQLDQEYPNVTKRYHKVIAWLDNVGNWDVQLDYWTDYRLIDSDATTVSAPISNVPSAELGIWDVGFWDECYWDQNQTTMVPVVFNLTSNGPQNNNEGNAIRLRFSNKNSGEPITVNAFSIIYTTITSRF